MSTENVDGKPNGFGDRGRAPSYTFVRVVQPMFNHSIFTSAVSPAAERIRFILGEEDDSPAPPQLFTELDELLAVDGQEMEWKETARWIKFEEKVEQGGERWSKPHVATLSLHSLFELRTCMEKGSIMFDREASSLPQLVELIVDHQIETGLLKPDLKDKVTYTLLRRHRHQTKKSNLRSLADIGKTVSSASRMFTNPDNGNAGPTGCCSLTSLTHLSSIFCNEELSSRDTTQRVQQIHMMEFANISNGCCEPPSFHEGKQPDSSDQLYKNTGAKSLWQFHFHARLWSQVLRQCVPASIPLSS
ncbi:hypothetical protein MC885_003343 [Smutsia gigantea]|nr:hypothetical protein MC885_003343 [Smutsia gigantea]